MQNIFFTPEQHLNENGLSLYADALRDQKFESLPQDLVQHVENCDNCKMQLLDVIEILNESDKDTVIVFPQTEKENSGIRIAPILYRIAAIFVIAAFIGVIYYSFSEKNTVPSSQYSQTATPTDTVFIETEELQEPALNDIYAENFELSPNLDDLVGTSFRSTSIEVVSPEIGAEVHSPISFRWKQFDRPVKIKILSNKEITLVTSLVKHQSFVTARTFVPGLYYWKLEADDELLFVGKFFVK